MYFKTLKIALSCRKAPGQLGLYMCSEHEWSLREKTVEELEGKLRIKQMRDRIKESEINLTEWNGKVDKN